MDFTVTPTRSQPKTKPQPRPFRWFGIYGEISSMTGLHTWGALETDIAFDGPAPDTWKTQESDISASATAGARLAGYGVIGGLLHLGGYIRLEGGSVSFHPDEWVLSTEEAAIPGTNSDFAGLGLGLATKIGQRIQPWLFFGFGLDVGLNAFKVKGWDDIGSFESQTLLGMELFPKVVCDIMAVDLGSLKLAFPIGIGAIIVPLSSIEPIEDADDLDNLSTGDSSGDTQIAEMKLHSKRITLALTMGIAIGF